MIHGHTQHTPGFLTLRPQPLGWVLDASPSAFEGFQQKPVG